MRIHTLPLLAAFALIALLPAGLSGCSAIVKSSVDAQPRVRLSSADLDDPSTVVDGDAVALVPPLEAATTIDADLVRWAPVIVQGVQPADERERYRREDDLPGSPALAHDGASVRIDTSRPAVFCRVEHAVLRDRKLKQLTYVFWYPRRPVGAVEKGEVDGGVLRVTLDAAGRPAVFEMSQACGCYHGVFVSDTVESAAVAQFASIERDRVHAVEPALNGRDDWVVRGLVVATDAAPNSRPVVYISAGRHFCEAIALRPAPPAVSASAYALCAYDELDMLPRDGGGAPGSMFNSDGLVIGGRRWKEELMLGDLDNAGWPRRLDVMKVNWDKERWTDPTLIETHLRMPDSVLDPSSSATNVAQSAHGLAASTMQAAERDQRLACDAGARGTVALFTHRACMGCQTIKRDVLPDKRVQARLRAWTLRVFDTATPDGAALAAQLRVSATPTLVVLDPDQRELSRSEDLLTVSEMLAAIP